MKLKTLSLIFLFSVFFVISSYSQYKYEIQLESFNDRSPQKVLEEISDYIEDSIKEVKEEILFFQTKVRYTEDNFREIAATAGYSIKSFKIIPKNEDDLNTKE